MKSVYILVLLSLLAGNLFAQASKDVYRFKNGSDISKMLSVQERFQFKEFMDGAVMFRGGKVTKAKLNYSVVHGEVMFISAGNDTMLITDNDFVKNIMVGQFPFIYHRGRGHIEIAGDYGQVRLGRKMFLTKMGNERYAAYDQYSSSSAISSYSSFTNADGRVQFLEGNDRVILRRRTVFFLVDKNDKVYSATKGNVLRFYSSQKRKVNDFMRVNKTNFDKEDDVVNLMAFCSSL
ncbi:MAG: hypothetical protein ABIN80_18135 [Dyadobacter sp.]|uniref:hypothetical protein n=1 Tax=Dyadobacter sp. TaxID=1914288 RepID=UPI0032656741